MKAIILNISIIITISLLNISCSLCQQDYGIDKTEAQDITERLSITFILGDDRENDNPYYAEAANYYKHSRTGSTEYVVTTCRSLLEVREHLTGNIPANGKPWGIINLVSHGNQWLGLSVRVAPDEKRATTERMLQFIDNGTFNALPSAVIDTLSEIHILGCGVGNNEELMDAVAQVFRCEYGQPKAIASRLFEYYSSIKYKGSVINTNKYEARAWTVDYKMGYRPVNNVISKWLGAKYPESNIAWNDALSREQPRWDGDIYHYTFEVPVKWVIKYPHKDSLPDVSTNAKKLAWIAGQKQITNDLEKIEIQPEKFNWWFRTVNVRNDDGTLSPAVWVKGYCTILCVIQPLTEENITDLLTNK